MPMLGRTSISTPSSTMVCCPAAGAVQGVAGAKITSTPLEKFHHPGHGTSGEALGLKVP